MSVARAIQRTRSIHPVESCRDLPRRQGARRLQTCDRRSTPSPPPIIHLLQIKVDVQSEQITPSYHKRLTDPRRALALALVLVKKVGYCLSASPGIGGEPHLPHLIHVAVGTERHNDVNGSRQQVKKRVVFHSSSLRAALDE